MIFQIKSELSCYLLKNFLMQIIIPQSEIYLIFNPASVNLFLSKLTYFYFIALSLSFIIEKVIN